MSLKDVTYPMASDPAGKLARIFGVFDESTGLSLRGTFIINPQGTLMNAEVNYYNLGRNIDELLRKFKANVHLSQHTDEACPVKWQNEGDKTLTPSADLVGKVHEALS